VSATQAILAWLLVLGTSLWLGGLVSIFVVARVAARTLDPVARVALFRGVGCTYAVVGTSALVLAYATGAALLHGRPWTPPRMAATVVAVALAATLGMGMAQARRMTVLRRRALDQPDDAALVARVRRGALRAAALRGLIGVLSLALLTLGVGLVD
jgi:hypothetical protein